MENKRQDDGKGTAPRHLKLYEIRTGTVPRAYHESQGKFYKACLEAV